MTEPRTVEATGDNVRTITGNVTWWELPVRDLEQATTFLTAVFDWTFASFGEGYEAAYIGGQMIGGVFRQDGAADGVRVYVAVDDLEATLGRVRSAGGTVVHERQEVGGDLGWWADFRAPDGLLLGISTARPAA